MMRILYLAHRYPYPPDKGEKIRAFHFLRGLAARHEVWLATLDDPEVAQADRSVLEELCKDVACVRMSRAERFLFGAGSLLRGSSLTEGYFHSRRLARIIEDWIEREQFDVALVFSSSMAHYLSGKTEIPLVIDFVDQDSLKWAEYAQQQPFPINGLYRLESRRLRAHEGDLLGKAARSLAITRDEAERFEESFPSRRLEVVGNGVDCDHFDYRPAEPSSRDLVFTGRMDYYPNVQAVVSFVREILPRIRDRVPDVRFFVVGAEPTQKVRALHDGVGVVVTGRVPDTRPYLHRAAIAAVPLTIGRGLQNKVLEALACGTAVVTTREGAQGIDGVPGQDLVVSRGGEEFADSVVELLEDPERRLSVAARGRELVTKCFSWSARIDELECILEAAAIQD